jgi:hypothetical protein
MIGASNYQFPLEGGEGLKLSREREERRARLGNRRRNGPRKLQIYVGYRVLNSKFAIFVNN